MSCPVAVLVDGDNISSQHAKAVLEVAARLGEVNAARVYVDAQRRSGWLGSLGFHVVHAGVGKNAADILLALDALEFLLLAGTKSFVVASSDGDFAHLATRLRERGARVVGVGENKAPDSFRACCSEFVQLGPVRSCQQHGAKNDVISPFDRQIRSMIASHSKSGAGMRIADLAPHMHREYGVKVSGLPERTWRAYLLKRPNLYDLDPRGPEAMVRFLPCGFQGAPR